MAALLKYAALSVTGFGMGLVVSAAVFAFIAAIGIIPRIAYRSGTGRYIRVYEEAIIFGGIFGSGTILTEYTLRVGAAGEVITGLGYGVFVGCLAVCLAEVLNVLPVLGRRAGLKKGLGLLIIALAAGKAAGTVIYFFVPGFMQIG